MTARRWQDVPKNEQKAIQQHLASMPEPIRALPSVSGGKGSFKLKGYVKCDLSASEKTEFQAWEAGREAGTSLSRLVGLVEDGYLLKVSPNSTGFQASLCASETGKPWDGYVLVAMARHALRAIDALVYKHDVALLGDWSIAMDDESEDFLR